MTTVVTNRFALRAPRPEDWPELYALMVDDQAGQSLRYLGATPTFNDFMAQAGDGVLAQFAIFDGLRRELCGLSVLSSPDFRHGFCFHSIVLTSPYVGTGVGALASLLTFEQGFLMWTFRKIYADVAEHNLSQFAFLADKLLHTEGRLRRHIFWRGEYHDVFQLAVYREEFQQQAPRLLAPFRPTEPDRVAL